MSASRTINLEIANRLSKHLLNSISYYQLSNSQTGIASAYLALGNLFSQQSYFPLALRYYSQSIDAFRKAQDTIRLATTLLNVSEVYEKVDKIDSSMLLLWEAKELFDAIGYDIGSAYALGNIGLAKIEQGDLAAGEEKILEATKILGEMGDNYAIAEYQLSLAKVYQERGMTDKALDYAQRSWILAEEDDLLEQMRNASERLTSLYVEKEDYRQAYIHQTRYLALKDSLSNIEVVQNMADTRTEFEVAQKQSEIDLLTSRRDVQRVIQLGLIVLSLLIVAIAWLYYRSYRIQKRANELLNRQQEELRNRNELLDALLTSREKFISIISHDLRGPIGAFAGLANVMKLQLAEQAYDALPTLVDHVEKAASHLSMLLDNLLNWALNQRGSISIQPERLSIKEVADEVVDVFLTMAMAKDITLRCLIHEPLHGWVDRNALFTILRNLVNNALKFTPEQGQVFIDGQLADESVVVRVIDTGVGIPEEKLGTLFQNKEIEHTWGTSGETGIGLGLQLVKEFVNRSEGTISVTSELNVGTTFTIRLPAHRSEAETVANSKVTTDQK